jgi:hypothetical protein
MQTLELLKIYLLSDLAFNILCHKNLHGLSPRTNYTDRVTAACRQSDCQLFADRGCHVVSVTDPYNRILGFLDRSSYFLSCTHEAEWIPFQTLFFLVPGIEPGPPDLYKNSDH